MLYFPQLSSDALTQYPVVKERRARTIVTPSQDGRVIKIPDHGSSEIAWELRHSGMTDTERVALEALFQAAEGRLQEFTFLDPMSNLLLWSGDPTAVVWTSGPLLTVAGTADPFGTNGASRISNSGSADQTIEQPIPAPGWFHYCLSMYVRSNGSSSAMLFRRAGSQTDSRIVPVNSSWNRVALSGKFDSTEEIVTFGIRLAPGATIDVYGLQVEPQVNPSDYKLNTTRCGVYGAARFSEDTLKIATHGVNQHSATIRIEAVIRS